MIAQEIDRQADSQISWNWCPAQVQFHDQADDEYSRHFYCVCLPGNPHPNSRSTNPTVDCLKTGKHARTQLLKYYIILILINLKGS